MENDNIKFSQTLSFLTSDNAYTPVQVLVVAACAFVAGLFMLMPVSAQAFF